MSSNDNEEYTPPGYAPPPQTPSTPNIGDVNATNDADTTPRGGIDTPLSTTYNQLGDTLLSAFSIDNDDTLDDGIDHNAPLEVDYGNDSDSDGGAGTSLDSNDDDLNKSDEALGLAAKTESIMNDYKDYIAEINSEQPLLDELSTSSSKKANLKDIERGRIPRIGSGRNNKYSTGMAELEDEFSNSASYKPYTVGGLQQRSPTNESQALKGSSGTNLHDIGSGYNDMSASDLAASSSRTSASASSSFGDFYGELGYHPRRKYSFPPLLRNKKFQKSVMGGLVVILVFGLIGGLVNNNKGDDAAAAASVEGEGKVDSLPSYQDINDEQIKKEYAYVAQYYEPQWFTRESGWVGTTYAEALMFCTTGAISDDTSPKGQFKGG